MRVFAYSKMSFILINKNHKTFIKKRKKFCTLLSNYTWNFTYKLL